MTEDQQARKDLQWQLLALIFGVMAITLLAIVASRPALGEGEPSAKALAIPGRPYNCWQLAEAAPQSFPPVDRPRGLVTLLLDECSGRTWFLDAGPPLVWHEVPLGLGRR